MSPQRPEIEVYNFAALAIGHTLAQEAFSLSRLFVSNKRNRRLVTEIASIIILPTFRFTSDPRVLYSTIGTTTVSRFFTDKAGAGPPAEDTQSPEEDSQSRTKPTLLQRLHIRTATRKAKPPQLAVHLSTASSFVEKADPSALPRSTFSDAATLEEITQIMPQSLTIGASSSLGSVKRQRSIESRDVDNRTTSAGQKWDGGQLKANVRIPAYLDKTKTEISSAFQDLEWKQRFRLFHAMDNPNTSPFRVDRSDAVVNRNRYGNVQPWDQSRIILNPAIDGSDYVNASPIVLKSRVAANDGFLIGTGVVINESKYIATQGPKQDQASHFWHMVMQETTGDEGVIVMLTQLVEANKEKCARYFPASLNAPTMSLPCVRATSRRGSSTNDSEEQTHSDSITEQRCSDTVKLISMNHDPSTACDVRIFELTIDNNTKTIHHYLFNGWPDYGRPEADDRIALLELTRITRRIAKDSPRFVHCSAGVGRTGTFAALDFLVHEIEEGRLVNINNYPPVKSPLFTTQGKQIHSEGDTGTWGKSGPPKVLTPTTEDFEAEDKNNFKDDLIYMTVNTLREQRMMMVMNELQYAFLYEVVREVFWSKYRTRPEGAVVKSTVERDIDVPKGKVAKVDDSTDDVDSASEAETEIMDKDGLRGGDDDPYAVVAPDQIREGIGREQ